MHTKSTRQSAPIFKPSANKQHFHGLDGLRGVAAIAVTLLHGSLILQNGYTFPSAALAVDFFFLLSGFVIAYAYDERLMGQGTTWSDFISIRFVRLYPMLFIGTAIGGFVFLIGQTQKSDSFGVVADTFMIVGSFFLLPVGFATGIPNAHPYPLNNPVWSLFFEFAVNAFYGCRIGRVNNRQLGAAVAISGVCLIMAFIVWPGNYQDIGFGSPTAFLLGFIRVSYPFWTGVLLFRIGRLRTLPSLPIGIVGLALASLLLQPFGGRIYGLVVIIAAFPALIAFSAYAQLSRSAVRICFILGELSYPLYLIHQPVFRVVVHAAERIHLNVPSWMLLLLGVAASIATSEVLLIVFDRPARRWLRRRLPASHRAQWA